MSENTESLMIRTGSDPRLLPEFIAIREEVNKSSHPSQPEMNWRLVESLALTLFRNNGVDLQTAAYYTLARTHLHGLLGFTEGCELLAGLLVGQWEGLWPEQQSARIDMLEWFNSRVGNQIRLQSFSTEDLRLLYRAERALQLIVDKLQQVELKRIPRVENLLYLMQNQVKNLERSKEQSQSPAGTPLQMPPLVYLTASDNHYASRREPAAVPEPPKVNVRYSAEPVVSQSTAKPVRKPTTAAQGFMLGIALSLLLGATLYQLQIKPLQQQLALAQSQPEGAALTWLAQPRLENYGELLERLAKRSPLALLDSGERMVQTAQRLWPDNALQQASSHRWQQQQQAVMGDQQTADSYYQTQQRVKRLADRLLEQEKQKGIVTISYLKTAVYEIQNSLNVETPLEELLRQLAAQDGKRQSPALLKHIDDRFAALLNRYHQLSQSIEPMR